MTLPERPIGPRDCALAVGIPLTRGQFFSDLARPDQKDFALQIKSKYKREGADDEYYWNSIYAGMANVMLKICNEVETLGVTVERAATLQDLTRLLGRFHAVTVAAHCRFREILPADILDPYGLLASLRSPQNQVQNALREEFLERAPHMLLEDTARMTHGSLQETISEIINPVVSEATALYARGDSYKEGMSGRALERITRVALEEAFPQVIAAAPAVELEDGCHSVGAVIEAVPVTFGGILDLTMCNSVIPGHAIKRRRRDCIVAVNRFPTEAHVRFVLYKLAIIELSRRPAPFMEVLTKLHKEADLKGESLWRLFAKFFKSIWTCP